MNTIEGIDTGKIVVRKYIQNLGSNAQFQVQLGGDLEIGSSHVVLHVESMEAALALYEACKEISILEVLE